MAGVERGGGKSGVSVAAARWRQAASASRMAMKKMKNGRKSWREKGVRRGDK